MQTVKTLMSRLTRSRLIWISTVCKCVSEFTWCPKFHDFTLVLCYFQTAKKLTRLFSTHT